MIGDINIKQGKRKEALEYFQQSLLRNPSKYQSIFSVAALKQANDEID